MTTKIKLFKQILSKIRLIKPYSFDLLMDYPAKMLMDNNNAQIITLLKNVIDNPQYYTKAFEIWSTNKKLNEKSQYDYLFEDLENVNNNILEVFYTALNEIYNTKIKPEKQKLIPILYNYLIIKIN